MYQSGVPPEGQGADYPLIAKRLYIESILKAGNSPIKRFLQREKIKKKINV
jgi:hypothetical protein